MYVILFMYSFIHSICLSVFLGERNETRGVAIGTKKNVCTIQIHTHTHTLVKSNKLSLESIIKTP